MQTSGEVNNPCGDEGLPSTGVPFKKRFYKFLIYVLPILGEGRGERYVNKNWGRGGNGGEDGVWILMTVGTRKVCQIP